MESINWKDIFIRAAKTFVQAAISIAVAQLAGVDFTGENIKNILINITISAGAAGVSAVWNAVLNPLIEKINGGNNNESA